MTSLRRLSVFGSLLILLVTGVSTAAEGPRSVSEPIVVPDAERTSVYVGHTGRDAAGIAFVDGVRTAIRSSKAFRLAASEDEASLVLVIVSVSPTPTADVASAISLAYVANNEWRSLLGSGARFVGRDRAESMGRATVEELTAVLDAYAPPGGR